MRPARRHFRPLALLLAATFAVCGWTGSSSGRLATAAIAERDHVLELSLGDGHLDLVREHDDHGATGGLAEPVAPDHVVHLCRALDPVPRSPSTDAPSIDGFLVASAPHRSAIFPEIVAVPGAPAAVAAGPPIRSVVLRL